MQRSTPSSIKTLIAEMRTQLYSGFARRDVKMSNVLVLSVKIRRREVFLKRRERCTAEHTARASKKKMASSGTFSGKWHWNPAYSPGNQIPIPTPEASTYATRVLGWLISVGDHSV